MSYRIFIMSILFLFNVCIVICAEFFLPVWEVGDKV
jgi:hypothetical protein